MSDYDVIVVGGGPTGVTLATLLARYGRSVCVVERHRDVYALPRAVHLDGEVCRILHELGVGAEFAAIARPTRGLQLVDARHRVLARFERTVNASTGLPEANLFDQPDLERVLRANLATYPSVAFLAGHEVAEVSQSTRDAVVDVHPVEVGPARRLRAPFVVGCDGANSVVRAAIGADLVDLGFAQRWLVVDVRSRTELTAWDGVHQVCDPRRAATYMRVGHDRYRFEIRLLDTESAARYGDFAALRSLLDPWLGGVPDEQFDLLRANEYTFRAVVADRWRDRRLFLAGDAAHLTPPFIGQGMCAGIRDASNLAWKLAAALDGSAGDLFLDSYQRERMPHAASLIKLAVNMGRAMTGGGALAALARSTILRVLRSVPAVRAKVLDATSPALTGPLVDERLPKRARGALLPLVRLEPSGHFVDTVLGPGMSVVATSDVAVPDRIGSLSIDPATAHGGERELLSWLATLGARWALVRPDRVVQAVGPDSASLAAALQGLRHLVAA